MNRIEIVGLFKAMKALAKNKNYEDLEDILDSVIEEASTKPDKNGKGKDDK